MADISIHNTKSIEIGELREVDSTRPFFTRDITITCYANSEEGEELKVSL